MLKRLLTILALCSSPAFAGEAPPQPQPPSLEEIQARFQATTQELVGQRDAAQARAANLAGDNAAKDLQIKQLQATQQAATKEKKEK